LDLRGYDVSLLEEPDAVIPQVRFCEGLEPTDAWLKYCGTAGKPGRKRRKQTSTCSIGRNRSTRLFKHFLPPLINFCDCPALGENLEEINVIIVLFDFLPSSGYEI